MTMSYRFTNWSNKGSIWPLQAPGTVADIRFLSTEPCWSIVQHADLAPRVVSFRYITSDRSEGCQRECHEWQDHRKQDLGSNKPVSGTMHWWVCYRGYHRIANYCTAAPSPTIVALAVTSATRSVHRMLSLFHPHLKQLGGKSEKILWMRRPKTKSTAPWPLMSLAYNIAKVRSDF